MIGIGLEDILTCWEAMADWVGCHINMLNSHKDGLGGHTIMLGDHMYDVGGHSNMLGCHRKMVRGHTNMTGSHIDGLDAIVTCWEAIWILYAVIVTWWDAIRMVLETKAIR